MNRSAAKGGGSKIKRQTSKGCNDMAHDVIYMYDKPVGPSVFKPSSTPVAGFPK